MDGLIGYSDTYTEIHAWMDEMNLYIHKILSVKVWINNGATGGLEMKIWPEWELQNNMEHWSDRGMPKNEK